MGALGVHLIQVDPADPIEDDGAMATLHVEEAVGNPKVAHADDPGETDDCSHTLRGNGTAAPAAPAGHGCQRPKAREKAPKDVHPGAWTRAVLKNASPARGGKGPPHF